MSRIAILAALFLAVTVAAGGAAAAQRAKLLVLRGTPATVQGRYFHPGERVRVTLTIGERVTRRDTRATPAGRFVVTFAGVDLYTCSAPPAELRAVGTRTGAVVAHLLPRDCAMP